MATTVIVADDFESYSVVGDLTATWSVRGTLSLLSPGNINTQSVEMNASNEDIYVADPGTGSYYSLLCRFRCSSIAAAPYIMGGTDNNSVPNRNGGAAWIRLLADGSIQVVKGTGAGTSQLAVSATGLISNNTTYELELRYFRDNSGYVNVYLDGVEVIAQTAGDTLFNATLGVLSFSNSTASAVMEYDDCVIRIDDTALPTAASTGYVVTDFSAGGGGTMITGVGGTGVNFQYGVSIGTGVSGGAGVGG